MPFVDIEKRRKYEKDYRERHPDRVKAAQKRYHDANKAKIRRYVLGFRGFTPELFDTVLEAQENRCPVCETDFASLPPEQRHADHCHESLRPRGVLCSKCNQGLGMFKDSPALLARAIEYLHNPTICSNIVAEDTIDEDVLLRHESKRSVQDLLLEAAKREMVK